MFACLTVQRSLSRGRDTYINAPLDYEIAPGEVSREMQ
jgi:hypothetical protein